MELLLFGLAERAGLQHPTQTSELAHGYVSLSLGITYEKDVLEQADLVRAVDDAGERFRFTGSLLPLVLERRVRERSRRGYARLHREVALGIHDDARMKADYELVRDYVGIAGALCRATTDLPTFRPVRAS